ncbi:MAG: hypothetical protein MI974_12825 [Chitinophagales bacterium]|nr:hypothetical protein [Chitinophagales bacterium]
MSFFQRKNKFSSTLDRPLLTLSNQNHPDDQFTVRDLFENIFIAGSTGTGKTSTVGYYLAKNLLNVKGVPPPERIGIIVFLYKAGDIHQWIEWVEAAHRLDDLVVIGPDDKDVFNILEAYQEKEAITIVDTLMILAGLTSQGNSKEVEAYWEQMNRQRLHRLICLAKLAREPLNILTLYRLHSSAPQMPEQMRDKQFCAHSYCWQMLAKAASFCGEEHEGFRQVEDYFVREMPYMADRTQSSILSMTGSILEPFVSSIMLRQLFCGKTTLSLDEMLSGKIVLINLPIQQYDYAAKLAQIMLKHVLQKRIEERDVTVLPNPVCLWIDEYQHFISPYDFLFLSTARSSRAGSVLMTQNVSNLYAQIGGSGKMAEERVNSLLALTNHKIFLAQNNHITNEFASKTIGMGIHRLGTSSVQIQQFAGNAGVSESYHYQVMPRDFTMLARGGIHYGGRVDAIVTATGKTFSNGRNYLKVSFKQPWM